MLTILNAVELSSEYLLKKGVDDSRINAEILLAHILKCKRMDLYLKFDQPLKEEEVDEYRKLIKRRGLREPLQYIIGKVEFYGLEFIVNENVLIPRPETELLVEEIITRSDKNEELKILDVGTGSGNIAIVLSKNLPNANIVSIDISHHTIKIAEQNAILNNINGKLIFQNVDVLDFKVPTDQKFDIIVSNPPYISINDYSSLEKELLEHEPKIALTDNNDGYSFYESISALSKSWLTDGGKLYFEIGINQVERVKKSMLKNGFENIVILKDYSGIERIIFGELNWEH